MTSYSKSSPEHPANTDDSSAHKRGIAASVLHIRRIATTCQFSHRGQKKHTSPKIQVLGSGRLQGRTCKAVAWFRHFPLFPCQIIYHIDLQAHTCHVAPLLSQMQWQETASCTGTSREVQWDGKHRLRIQKSTTVAL